MRPVPDGKQPCELSCEMSGAERLDRRAESWERNIRAGQCEEERAGGELQRERRTLMRGTYGMQLQFWDICDRLFFFFFFIFGGRQNTDFRLLTINKNSWLWPSAQQGIASLQWWCTVICLAARPFFSLAIRPLPTHPCSGMVTMTISLYIISQPGLGLLWYVVFNHVLKV